MADELLGRRLGLHERNNPVAGTKCFKQTCNREPTHVVNAPAVPWRLAFCDEHTDSYRRHQDVSPHYGYTFEPIDPWARAAERLRGMVGE